MQQGLPNTAMLDHYEPTVKQHAWGLHVSESDGMPATKGQKLSPIDYHLQINLFSSVEAHWVHKSD